MWKGKEIVNKIIGGKEVHLEMKKALFCQVEKREKSSRNKVFQCRPRNDFEHLKHLEESIIKQKSDWLKAENDEKDKDDDELHKITEAFSFICFILVASFLIGWIVFRLIIYVVKIQNNQVKERLDRQFGKQASQVLLKIPLTILNETDIIEKELSIDTCAVCIENCK